MDTVERLIIDLKESLEREMHAHRDRLDGLTQEVRQTNEMFSVRVDRHGALLQTGSRWTNRMNQWAERVDKSLASRDKQIAELDERLRRLENNKSE